MLLSIIIPVYNAASSIEKCVATCYKQGLDAAEIEVILVDDGSTDDSLLILHKLEAEYTNIRIFHQDNQGQGVARNKGLDMAVGKYICFCDSDDCFEEESLCKIVDQMETNKLDVCCSVPKVFDAKGDYIMGVVQPVENYKVYTGEEVILNGGVFESVCYKCFLNEFIQSNNLHFKEKYAHEDVLFNVEFFPLVNRIMFTDICTYNYFWNGNSTDRSLESKKLMHGFMGEVEVAATLQIIADKMKNGPLRSNYLQRENSTVVSLFLRLQNSTLSDRYIRQKYVIMPAVETCSHLGEEHFQSRPPYCRSYLISSIC